MSTEFAQNLPESPSFLTKRVILDIGDDFHRGGSQGNERTWRREPRERRKRPGCRARSICRRNKLVLALSPSNRDEERERLRNQKSQTMSASTVAARRALQQQQARYLYRRALKSVLNWAVHREIFYVEVKTPTCAIRKEQESIKWVFSDPVMWSRILDFLHILAS